MLTSQIYLRITVLLCVSQDSMREHFVKLIAKVYHFFHYVAIMDLAKAVLKNFSLISVIMVGIVMVELKISQSPNKVHNFSN